jgi:flagellar protein FliS
MDPRAAYREGAARGASGPRLVVLLYEQAIQDLRRAALEMDRGNVELRTRYMNHAVSVIGHLQETLDREKGGQVARNLDRFYGGVRTRLMEAQVKASRVIIDEQITFLLSVRESWIEVDRATSIGREVPQPDTGKYAETVDTPPKDSTHWSA